MPRSVSCQDVVWLPLARRWGHIIRLGCQVGAESLDDSTTTPFCPYPDLVDHCFFHVCTLDRRTDDLMSESCCESLRLSESPPPLDCAMASTSCRLLDLDAVSTRTYYPHSVEHQSRYAYAADRLAPSLGPTIRRLSTASSSTCDCLTTEWRAVGTQLPLASKR